MDMSDETTTLTSINSHSTWSSNRYYEIILLAFSLGLTNTEQFMEESMEPGLHAFFGYIAVLVILGVPLVIVELSLGQYSRKGIIKFWEICPLFYGFGYLSFVLTLSNMVLNLTISSQILKYTLNQFFWESGWDKCSNEWNSEYCFTLKTNFTRILDCYDLHGEEDCDRGRWESSYNQYFYRTILIHGNDIILWTQLLLASLTMLALTGIAYKGWRFMEKCILICILLAAVNFSILLYVSLIQRGAGEGLKLYMRFNFVRLKELEFWTKAFEQTVWTTGIGQGALKLLGSENKFRGHSYMNGLMIILLHISVTFVELILYLILCGNISYTLYQPVETAFHDKENFMFAKIPKMLESLQGSHKLWCFLYYSHLFLIVFSKMLVLLHVILESTVEIFPRTQNHPKKTIFIACIAIICCCVPCMSKLGSLFWIFLDQVAIRGSLILFALLFQLIVIIYIYGLATVVDDLHFMLGFRISLFYQIILFLSPVITFICYVVRFKAFMDYAETVAFISEAEKRLLVIVQFLPIVVKIGYIIWHTKKMIWTCKWENVLSPSDSWYLTDQILRKSREMFSSSNMTEEYLYRQSKRREIHAHETMYDNE
ncbi:hypothetical protein WA026_001188 [Henosepilachna vigintioctopunctata]|uniref:Uncharacterized protein n=1 Tax=Henosepilachna vigintioctopunctata TaxID=420089 RepID=A0AAW1UHK7_9CUCU